MLFKNRRKKILNFLKKNNCESFLVYGTYDVFYLTGFYGSYGFLILSKDKNFLLVDGRYLEEANKCAESDLEVVLIKDFLSDLKKITDICKLKNITFDADSIYVSLYNKINSILEKTKFVPLKQSPVKKLRSIKDDYEIKIIKEAIDISKKIFNNFVKNIKFGITEKNISADLNYMLEIKAEGCSFDTIVLSGKRTSLPHGKPEDKVVHRGEAILIDYGLMWKKYCTDHTRVVFLGNNKLKKYYKIVKDAFQHALNYIKPGVEIGKIDLVVKEYFAKYNLEKNFLHSTGHGIGLEVHEYPVVNFKNKDKLKEGMIITVEPGLYFPDEGGVRYEEMILVTDKGFELL